MTPGIHRGIPFDAYASWDAANSHQLGVISRRTPAHAFWEATHGGAERSDSLDLGWLVHLAVLEPDRYAAEIVVPPKVDRRTKAGKALWAEWEAAHPAAMLVDEGQQAKVDAIRSSLLGHPTAWEFLSGPGSNELSLVWEESNTACKARIDRVGKIGEWAVVGDLKTTRNAALRAVERDIHAYGYHIQAAHYLAGLEALAPQPPGNPRRRFVWLVVETEPPYLTAVYEIDDSALDEGEARRQRALRAWRTCRESGVWPGYPDGIELASLPPWAFKELLPD